MKKTTFIRSILTTGALTLGSAALAGQTVAWFDGGVDTAWPVHATNGSWSCPNIGQLKWTETFIPAAGMKVPGLTLDNWAFVGLRCTAAKAVNLGFGGGVTAADFTTKVLLQPVMKDDLPGIDSDDKGGVILVHEDDGSLRYYVLAQADEANGTGANVWKLATSLSAETDDTAPATIAIGLRQDGTRWLVDYAVNGARETTHVIAIGGAAPTLSSLRYTGPCTVQALSASYVRYPAWLNTTLSSELAKYDAWAAKYGVTDTTKALQRAYLLGCDNTAEAIAVARQTAADEAGTTVRFKDRGNGVARDVYLLIGQSNMAGRGQLTSDNRILPVAGILSFGKDNRWIEAVEPLHWDKAQAGAGLAASFAVEMKKVSGGREIGLVPCAVGGSYISSWVPGGELYSNALVRCRAALAAGGTLKGILWHQGESDANASLAALYAGRLSVVINALRIDLNAPELPFVAGELTTAAVRDNSYDFDTISKITKELIPTIPNCGFATSEGLTMNSDGLHFNTPSVRTLGQRYAAEMLRLQGRSSD